MEIRLTDQEKMQKLLHPSAVYGIMQRILLRENKIDQEKEHFWMIGLNGAGCLLYLELVSLGGKRSVNIEPMNVYRFAVIKNADRVIAVHNHPSGNLTPSESDKDLTDRLIQVGRILGITMEDHLIISTTAYQSFESTGLMSKLRASLRYVPNKLAVEKIRMEEKAIAGLAVKAERAQRRISEAIAREAKEKTRETRQALKAMTKEAQIAKEEAKAEREQRLAAERSAKQSERALSRSIKLLAEKNMPIEEIAKVLKITLKEVEQAINKKK